MYITYITYEIRVSLGPQQPMQRTQIYLSESEKEGLQALSQRSGRSQSALIREAIDAYLQQNQPQKRLEQLRRARGIWTTRQDLPDWSSLRQELDRLSPVPTP